MTGLGYQRHLKEMRAEIDRQPMQWPVSDMTHIDGSGTLLRCRL